MFLTKTRDASTAQPSPLSRSILRLLFGSDLGSVGSFEVDAVGLAGWADPAISPKSELTDPARDSATGAVTSCVPAAHGWVGSRLQTWFN